MASHRCLLKLVYIYIAHSGLCPPPLIRSLKKRKKESRQRKKEKKNPPRKKKLNKKATWSNSLTLMTKVSRSKSSYVYVKELKVFIYITDIQKSVQVNKIKGLVILV